MKFYNLIFIASTLSAGRPSRLAALSLPTYSRIPLTVNTVISSAKPIEATTTDLQSGFQTKTLIEVASKVFAREEAVETCKIGFEHCQKDTDCCSCWCVEYALWGWLCGGYEHPPVDGCTPQPPSRTPAPPAIAGSGDDEE